MSQYGQIISGLQINGSPAPYPVVNERAVRAGAGIMFALGLFAFFQAFYLDVYIYIQILVVVLLIDFSIKVFLQPSWSPFSAFASFIVRKQTPEYVGAIQKRFAWSIGLSLALLMTVLIFGFGILNHVNLLICAVCLTFMFMESAFGICVGCKLYALAIQYRILKEPVVKPACPGNVCSIE